MARAMLPDAHGPRLIVHIGPHKTASSYLQANFAARRGALKAAGWMYPRLGMAAGEVAHHALASAPRDWLDPRTDCAKRLAHLGRRARRNNFALLLSSEAFSAWPVDHWAALASLTGMTPELAIVLRDPRERALSYWAEEVKQGHVTSLPERLAPDLAAPLVSPLLNPLLLLDRLSAAHLPLRLVRWPDRPATGVDFFARFAQNVLGVLSLAAVHRAPRNARFPIEMTELLRLQNAQLSTRQRIAALPRLMAMAPPARAELSAHIRALIGPPHVLTLPADGIAQRFCARQLSRRYAAQFCEGMSAPPRAPRDVHCPYYPDRQLWGCAPMQALARDFHRDLVA